MIGFKLIRAVSLCLFSAVFVYAQDAPTLAALEQTAQERTEQWQKLSQNLDTLLIRLLPCDPKVATSIEEVSKASEARVAAVIAYMQAANRQAQLQASAAKQVVASAQNVGADLAAEKADLSPERAALEMQLANLTQSSQRRASLRTPIDSLKQVLAAQQQRSDAIDAAIARTDPANGALADLAAQLQARQAAWDAVQTAFEQEGSRWSAYYVARAARAQMECTITNPAPTASKPVSAPGKQK